MDGEQPLQTSERYRITEQSQQLLAAARLGLAEIVRPRGFVQLTTGRRCFCLSCSSSFRHPMVFDRSEAEDKEPARRQEAPHVAP